MDCTSANYLQADSRFSGADGAAHFDVGRHFELDSSGASYVRAKLTDTGESLPRIPPFQGRLEAAINLKSWSITPEIVFAGEAGPGVSI